MIMEINKGKKKYKKKKKHIGSNVSERTNNTEQYGFNYDRDGVSDNNSMDGFRPRSEMPTYQNKKDQRRVDLYGDKKGSLQIKI